MVREALIIAAGKGSRMAPASLYCPKELLPLVDTPLIYHIIWESIRAGVSKINFVVSPEKLDLFRKLVEGHSEISEIRPDLSSWHLKPIPDEVDVIIHVQNNPLGVGDAIKIGCKEIDGPFLVLLGDNAFFQEVPDFHQLGPESASQCSKILVEHHLRNGEIPCVGVFDVEKEKIGNYGAVVSDKGKLISVTEKPSEWQHPESKVICGRYIFPTDSFQILEELSDVEDYEFLSIHFLNELAAKLKVELVDISSFDWVDAGQIEDWWGIQSLHYSSRKSKYINS